MNQTGSLSEFSRVISISGFRYLWFGQIFSQIANNTLLFVLALVLYSQTASNTAVSGIFLVYGIPAVLFGFIAGTLVDKLENRKVLISCDVIRAVFVVGLIAFPSNIAVIYLLTFLNAIVTQFYIPSEAPTIPYLVPEKYLVNANSLFSFTYFSSLAIGSVFSGPFLKIFGPVNVFIILAIFFVIAAYFVSHVPNKLDYQYSVTTLIGRSPSYLFHRLLANLKEGIAYVQSRPTLQDALMLLMGTQILIALLGALGPGFADRILEIEVHNSSVFITGPVVLGIILGALWVGSKGSHIAPSILIWRGIRIAGLSLIAISLVVRVSRMAFTDNTVFHLLSLPMTLILFFILGYANSLLDVPANTILQKESQGDMRGRLYGMLAASVGGIGVLPVVIGGFLADVIGVGKVLFFLGLIVFFYSIVRKKYGTIQT